MKPSGKSRLRYLMLLIVISIFILSFLLILCIRIVLGSHQRINFSSKVAVIYAYPTFHEEIVSAFSCMLHDMGFKVFIYVGSGVNALGVQLPFTDLRKENSEKFYGKCISQWESLSYPAITSVTKHYAYKPDIMVFITYPMRLSSLEFDYQATDIIRSLVVDDKSKTPVVLVTHHPVDPMHLLDLGDPIHSILPLNQTTFMFLGQHTEAYSRRMFTRKVFAAAGNRSIPVFRTNYLYPVMPLEWILKPDDGNYESRHKPTFVMQGNFGGSHADKKDPRGVVDCLRQIEKNSSSDLSIDFVGNLHEQIDVGKLKNGNIRFLSGLDQVHFYAAIADAKFLVLGSVSEKYFRSAASSSVPAALITHVPLVSSERLLQLYPCLRDGRIHRYMAKDSECDAMRAALSLSDDQYREAKEEIKNCSHYHWIDAKNKLWGVIN